MMRALKLAGAAIAAILVVFALLSVVGIPSGFLTSTIAARIDRVTVSDGTIVFSNPRDRVENRIGSIDVDAAINADRSIKLDGTARASDHPLKFVIKATPPPAPLERQSVPVELTLDMPDILS